MSTEENGVRAAPDMRYVRNPAILAASLGADELALLDAARGKYFGLNSPGSRIWELLETPRTIGDLCETLIVEFAVDPAECAQDTRELIAEMVEATIVLGTDS